jgi:hypothetical protein
MFNVDPYSQVEKYGRVVTANDYDSSYKSKIHANIVMCMSDYRWDVDW